MVCWVSGAVAHSRLPTWQVTLEGRASSSEVQAASGMVADRGPPPKKFRAMLGGSVRRPLLVQVLGCRQTSAAASGGRGSGQMIAAILARPQQSVCHSSSRAS